MARRCIATGAPCGAAETAPVRQAKALLRKATMPVLWAKGPAARRAKAVAGSLAKAAKSPTIRQTKTHS